ncbi:MULTISPECIES: hypothetical protein [Actinoalloteichus]|uniref:Uncharacterized protein n=1 Tax=Actinoalloteichus fjordicus TaxID=1612552 RepID=A0AAC9PR49_9PSEU|nr:MULTISPECIES: hypothetical protein [Actinoalloteichus]APU13733.1 hypothetical protein UA74_08335 [Actinoalloteichus fjordicus]APU19679.1 hypothetical protein UA75_08315 [Actinoalloteichus sp. GBA129-24]
MLTAVLLTASCGLFGSGPQACGCALPPDDSEVIPTVQRFAQALAEDDSAAVRELLSPDAQAPAADEQARWTALTDPAARWIVVSDHAMSYDAETAWLVLGTLPGGPWVTAVVHDRATGDPGTVDPSRQAGTPAEILHAGSAPVVVHPDDDGSGIVLLVDGDGRLAPLEPLSSHPPRHLVEQAKLDHEQGEDAAEEWERPELRERKWIHTGEPLARGDYTVIAITSLADGWSTGASTLTID